ncbi:MAG TPA: hypothetical protein VHL51_10795 [Gaiellales bacterium]|jgi:hypothetical protein|nr:hypothetical protein [Gaiellales bacterium]
MTDTPDRVDQPETNATPEPEVAPVTAPVTAPPPQGMLPARESRRFSVERGLMRVIATCGIIAIGTALAAILGSADVAAWIIGLAVSALSVVLAALLWSSRQL